MPEIYAGDDGQSTVLDQMVTVLNHGWLVLVLSLGERTGLHDVLKDEPQTIDEIALAAECDPRYTEIWLWAMVASRFVVSSALPDGTQAFAAVAGARTVLTSAGGPDHWARITEQITALAALEDDLVSAFHTGSGLSADLYEGRITEVLSGESGPIFRTAVLGEVLPHFGLDDLMLRGAKVADLGCGTGELVCMLAERFPRSQFIGVDQSGDAIERAQQRAAQLRLDNVRFMLADLEDGILVDEQDLIVAANVAHDLSDPERFFRAVNLALSPEGIFYLHELTASEDMSANVRNPHAIGILAFSLYHCLPLAKRRTGIAPGGMYGRQRYLDSLRSAGFRRTEVYNAPSDPSNDTIIAKKSEK